MSFNLALQRAVTEIHQPYLSVGRTRKVYVLYTNSQSLLNLAAGKYGFFVDRVVFTNSSVCYILLFFLMRVQRTEVFRIVHKYRNKRKILMTFSIFPKSGYSLASGCTFCQDIRCFNAKELIIFSWCTFVSIIFIRLIQMSGVFISLCFFGKEQNFSTAMSCSR